MDATYLATPVQLARRPVHAIADNAMIVLDGVPWTLIRTGDAAIALRPGHARPLDLATTVTVIPVDATAAARATLHAAGFTTTVITETRQEQS